MWGALSDKRTGLSFTIAPADIFGSDSHGTRDHNLLSQIRDFLFCRLLLLAGLRWRYSTPPLGGPEREHLPSRFSPYIANPLLSVTFETVWVASGTVDYLAVTAETRLAKPLPNDSRIFCFHYSGFQAACHNTKPINP
jgi:hypothetical protein